jgi:hypothetical protein
MDACRGSDDVAGDENAAVRQSVGWEIYAVDFLNERTWLVVTLGDATVFSEALGKARGEAASVDHHSNQRHVQH